MAVRSAHMPPLRRGRPAQLLLRRFPSRGQNIRRFLTTMRCWLRRHRISAALVHDIELTVAEVLNNIREHAALPGAITDIAVRCQKTTAEVIICVDDFGVPMPMAVLNNPAHSRMVVRSSDLAEGGYGWLIVTTLTSGVRYCRLAGCNRLQLKFVCPRECRGADPPPRTKAWQ